MMKVTLGLFQACLRLMNTHTYIYTHRVCFSNLRKSSESKMLRLVPEVVMQE